MRLPREGELIGYIDVLLKVPDNSHLFVGSSPDVVIKGVKYKAPYLYDVSSRTDKYFIPGSSIKGALRSLLEVLYQDSCVLFKNKKAAKSWRWILLIRRLGINLRNRRAGPCGRCEVCRIFGYSKDKSGSISSVLFSDFVSITPNPIERLNLRIGHRNRYENLLVFRGGSIFRGRMNFVIEKGLLGLLSMVMFSGRPILLGYKRLRQDLGFGRVILEPETCKLLRVDRGPKYVSVDCREFLSEATRIADERYGSRLRQEDLIRVLMEVAKR